MDYSSGFDHECALHLWDEFDRAGPFLPVLSQDTDSFWYSHVRHIFYSAVHIGGNLFLSDGSSFRPFPRPVDHMGSAIVSFDVRIADHISVSHDACEVPIYHPPESACLHHQFRQAGTHQ